MTEEKNTILCVFLICPIIFLVVGYCWFDVAIYRLKEFFCHRIFSFVVRFGEVEVVISFVLPFGGGF